MENKKSKKGLIVLGIILALLVGFVGGYFVTDKFVKNNGEEGNDVNNALEGSLVDNNLSNSVNTEVDENDKNTYDFERSVKVGGETYTLGFKEIEREENIEGENVKEKYLEVYMFDRRVKTMKGLSSSEDVIVDSKITAVDFCDNYILLAVEGTRKIQDFDPVEFATFCILTTNGEHIETLEWSNATSVTVIETGESLKYKIEKDRLEITEINGTEATIFEYRVYNNCVTAKIAKFYESNEVSLAGK